MRYFTPLFTPPGYEGGLVGLRALPFDNYSVPLVIQDQQNSVGRHTVQVVVCDCGDGDVCLSRKSSSSSLGAAGIGFLLLGLFLLLCEYGNQWQNV